MEKVEIDIDGKVISLEAGDLARQANGTVVVRQGDTMVLVAATMADKPREGIDFFPLTVDFREKAYSAGKIPGGFFKREARPSDIETLICRLIDRPIRPLFPDEFRNETQIVCMVVSHDKVNRADINSITAASAALLISDIPFTNPIAGARIGRVDGKLIFNPTFEESDKSDLELVMAGTADGIVMVEAGSLEVSEDDMMAALEFGHDRIKKIIKIQETLREKLGKPKAAIVVPEVNQDLKQKVDQLTRSKLEAAMKIANKQERSSEVHSIRDSLSAELNPEADGKLRRTE